MAIDVFNGLSPAAGTFTPISISDYRERISYDPNGNILTYERNGDAARLTMDNMSYFYKPNTNQLHKVTDAAADALPADYSRYNDIKQGQADNNYQYDAIGNMTKDNSEGITDISWSVYGKILTITKSGSIIKYVYDASGNRILKYTATDTTVYVRDASGNVMSVYSKPAGGSLAQTETHLYGSSRLGMATSHLAPDTTVILSGGFGTGTKIIFARGEKIFELGNHLGTVLVNVSDRKIQSSDSGNIVEYYLSDVKTAIDYYPFGMMLPGRTHIPGNHRYGFGGQETSPEIKGIGNSYSAEFWEYDPRLGRRWNVDPIFKEYESPFAAFGNNPIWNVDPYGADTAKYLSNQQLVDAIRIGYNVINNAVQAKTYNAAKDASKELQLAIDAYWDKHQESFSYSAYAEFSKQVFEYHKGLKEVATASATAWERLGDRITNDDLSLRTNILQTYNTIQLYNGATLNLVTMGANVAMAIATGSVGAHVGAGPKGPQISSRKQQAIVTTGAKPTTLVPSRAVEVAKYAQANSGAAMQGYKGGRAFLNDGRGGGQVLPKIDANGKSITYKEYDVNPFNYGINRGPERVVIGSDGKSYYTTDHYKTFIQF